MSLRVWIVGLLLLSTLGCEEETGEPGSVIIHRLNRAEYNNTVRDLMGTSLTPAEDFPADDHGYGFDNISDIQGLYNYLDLYIPHRLLHKKKVFFKRLVLSAQKELGAHLWICFTPMSVLSIFFEIFFQIFFSLIFF